MAAGTVEVVSNQLKITSVGGGAAFALHPDTADVRITATAGDGNNRALYARVLGSDWLFAFSSGGNIGVYEYVAGSPTLLDFVAGSLSASDTLAMQAVGTNVKIYKNGALLLSTTTSVTAAGKSGVWSDTQNTVFDDFSAEVYHVEASGALVAGSAAVDGAATSGSAASGVLVAQAASIDGASSVAWEAITSAGALQAPAASINGLAISGSQASGSLSAQAAQIDGGARSSSVAVGDLVAQAAAIAGAATVAEAPIAAAGGLVAGAAGLDGVAISGSVAAGALMAGAAAVSGQAVVSDAPAIVAVGDLVAGPAVIAGAATVSGEVAATEEADSGGAGGRAGTVWINFPPPLAPAPAVVSARGGLAAGPAQIRGVAVLGKTAKQKRNERTLRMLLLAA